MHSAPRLNHAVVAALLAGVLAVGAHAQEKTIVVAPHKVPVTGVFPGLCFLVADESETQWKPLDRGIEGFVFRWGFRYKLSVVEEPTSNGSTKLRLVKVLNERDARPSYAFEIPLTAARVVPAPNGTFYICGEKQFALAEGGDAQGFAKALGAGARLNCRFTFAQDNAQPLVLLGWKPVGAAGPTVGAGGEIPSDAPPILRNGSTLVPLRAIFEWLGAEVDYDAASHAISATKDPHSVRLRIGSTTALVDGASVSLEAPPMETGGRTYVPLRFVSEALGAKVEWDADARLVTVIDGQRAGTLRVP
ncbi:MAG: DUF4377 domain-containing protein [Armatimonadetes bacterium]|nr:DUF4377 domain-containing protein [Armatimonadota bacterium]